MNPAFKAQAASNANAYAHDMGMAWLDRNKDIRDAFRADLANEYLSDLPESISALVFERAWDDGHSNGYHSVELIYGDLADLVRRIVKEAIQ